METNEAKTMIEAGESHPHSVSLAGIELTEGEFLLLESLVSGPAYPLLQRLLARVGAQAMSQLEIQKETIEIHRLQGQIHSYRWLQNFPGRLVIQERSRRKNTEERKAKKKLQSEMNPARPASP